MDLGGYLRDRGGFASRASLASAGVSDFVLRSQTRAGLVVRVRQGWYAAPDADPDAMNAVRAGGRLACVSALKFHGVWVLDDGPLHISCPPGRGSRRSGFRVHTDRARSERAIESPAEALARFFRCGSRPAFIASADSALHGGLVTAVQLAAAVGPSRKAQQLLSAVDGRSESGIETLARLALRHHGVQFTPQAVIPGVGRVDLVVGDRLVVELDSWKWHSDREAFERDRRRDLGLAARGYLPVRISYRRVLDDWSAVESELLAIVRAGAHRWHGSARRLHERLRG